MGVRFAPSPTGRFHIGNLRTAWISFRWAKYLKLPWVVRFEDIDTPRVVSGAQEQQLADMAALGLVPDQIFIQSEHRERHWQLFQEAQASGAVYPCFCSRKEVLQALQDLASAPHREDIIYNGHCRNHKPGTSTHSGLAWRFRNADPTGAQDFIVARTDSNSASRESFVPSYHWACAIDDWDGQYDLLVRAWDLKGAALQQRAIQNWLALRDNKREFFSAIFHCSLVVGPQGERLEKRTQGVTFPELLAKGLSAKASINKFERSFLADEFAQFQAQKLWGERQECLLLAELLRE